MLGRAKGEETTGTSQSNIPLFSENDYNGGIVLQ